MGLFINHNEHPKVFKNNGEILEPNQGYFHRDNFADMINEQKKINQSLTSAFQEIKALYHHQQHVNASKWKNVGDQLQALNDRKREHEAFERQAMEWLAKLDRNNQQLQHILENEDTMTKEVAGGIASLNESSRGIVERLAAYEVANQEMAQQMKELADMNRKMSDQVADQDKVQKDMSDRLENQEALMEKVHRQISEFRTILFERSSYLAEKIEDSYNLTSSYFYKLVSGSDKPLTLYMGQRKSGSEQRRD
ncbi:hypothetical protein GCM10007063_30450 [Lentibacillus kapialis]|uniref:t-SNARE coiled-coil homology domain-containing protein n=1 Tax=Lentibacillus kapialis TaxID=340214 RepID=A0A917Q199_9BACI|nr:hypothetical protein [Lentibacillus kapialis]GGK05946.1 hypothetical protein GCM10007063_30450 [Lentibacillus kapialis]